MAAVKKKKAYGMMQPGGVIRWLTAVDQEAARNIPNGSVVAVEMRRNDRNIKHHRKAFALLQLGYSYWVPEWEFVSMGERHAAHATAKRIAIASGMPDLYENVTRQIAQEIIQEMAIERQKRFDPESLKTFEAFRAKMMIDAGYFDVVTRPDGGTVRQPRSMSFMSMSQQEFNEVYKGLFGAVWNRVLSTHFANESQVDNAIAQMESFI